MSEETRPLWGVILGIVIILVVGTLFIYGQRQRVILEQEEQIAAEEAKPDPLVIGGIVPLSGEDAERGVALQKAALIALSEINKEGGIAERPVSMIWKDSKCQGSAAVTGAQELLTIDDVNYVIGGACDESAKAVAPITNQHKAIFISPAATDSQLSKIGGEFFFRTVASATDAARAAATYSKDEVKASKITIIYSEDRQSTLWKDSFAAEFAGDSDTEITSIPYVALEDEENPAERLAQQVEDSESELLYLVTKDAANGVAVLSEIAESESLPRVITTEQVIESALALAKANQTDGEEDKLGALAQSALAFKVVDDNNKMKEAFVNLYKQETAVDAPHPQEMANAYSLVYLLKDAIEKAGDDTESVKGFLNELNNWEHALGQLTFDEEGDRVQTLAIWQARNGELKQIGTQKLN